MADYDMVAADRWYWPEWVMTYNGNSAHLERLDEGKSTDTTLCGKPLNGSQLPRRPDVYACYTCEAIAQQMDDDETPVPIRVGHG